MFRSDRERLEAGFILHCFSRGSAWTEALGLSTGGTPTSWNRLKEAMLLRMSIPLPPLSEQRRIVAKIDELAAKIDEARHVSDLATIFQQSLMISRIEAACFGRDFRPTLLGDVLIEAKNGIYKPGMFWGKGVPCIRMYNIEGPRLNQDNLQSIDVTPEELLCYGCNQGDMILNRVNSAELVGKTGVVPSGYPACVFEAMNMRLRVNVEQVVPDYAAYVLNANRTKEYFQKVLKQQCGQASLNQTHVRNIPFPLRSLVEQRRIVAHLDALQAKVDSLKALQAQTAAELDALLPSVLDKAFKGEL